jgi:uncharacterized protein
VKAFTGVFDVFAGSMIRALSNSDLGHELIIGPWGHYGGYQLPYGVRQHQHAPGGKAWGPVALAWFDRWLKGAPEQPAPGSSKVYYFMSGENQWTTTPAWPPAGGTRELFLNSEDSTEGGAALTFDRPADSRSRTYTYDPADPVQTVGGATIELTGGGLSLARFDDSMANDGVHDQRRIEGRDDILLYTSPVLETSTPVPCPNSAQRTTSPSHTRRCSTAAVHLHASRLTSYQSATPSRHTCGPTARPGSPSSGIAGQ